MDIMKPPVSREAQQNLRDVFRESSLHLLRHELQIAPVPGYPRVRLTYQNGAQRTESGLFLPEGEWETSISDKVPQRKLEDIAGEKDTFGRPVHPWTDEMLKDPAIGVVTGRGSYYEWGPNLTADPIICRYDYHEPVVLLIKRRQTGLWALPGGHVDPGEESLTAAMREAKEETAGKIVLDQLTTTGKEVYRGPVADVRMTANAWPETTAYRFDIPDSAASQLQPIGVTFAGDSEEVEGVRWSPVSEMPGPLYGSHSLLIYLALKQDGT